MSGNRRRPKSRRNRWLTPVFAVVLVGMGAAGWGIAQEAQDAVLESQSGSISSVSLDPEAPGFRAFTEPTPTALVLHTAVTELGRAELIGASFLAAADEGRGGTVVSIPSTLIDERGASSTLSAQFATDGFAAVVDSMKDVLGIGFSDVVVLDAGAWVTLMAPDLPLTLTLRNDLVENPTADATLTVLAAGTREFTPAEVGLIASHVNPGEPSINLAARHQEIWRAWISRTAVASDRPQLFGAEEGFVDLIGDLTNGEVGYQMVPIAATSENESGETLYAVDAAAVGEIVARVVTFPIPSEPGGRPSVMVLDGTGGSADERSILREIVAGGGQVAILGNADSAGVSVSEIQVHDAQVTEVARAIADALDIAPPVAVPLTDATVAITVIVGADLAPAA